MKKLPLLLALVSSVAMAEQYDIAKYCATVAEAAGGSYQIENACRKQELDAKAKLAAMKLPARIENYCSQVGGAIGGSYHIKLACVQQELARADMK